MQAVSTSRPQASSALPDDPRGVGSAPALRQRRWLELLVVAVCLLLVVALWTGTFIRAGLERDDAVANAVRANDNLAAAFEQYNIRTLQNADGLLLDIIREYAHGGSFAGLAHLTATQAFARTEVELAAIADEHGALLASTTGSAAGSFNFSDREQFQVHVGADSGHMYVGKPEVSRQLGVVAIPVTRRINKPDGSFGGVASVQLNPAQFTDFNQHAERAPGDALVVLGLDGAVRAEAHGSDGDAIERVDLPRLLTLAKAQSAGHYVTTAPGGAGGSFVSFRTLADYPLVVVAATDESAVLAPTRQRQQRYVLVASAITAFIALSALLLVVLLQREWSAQKLLVRNEKRLQATFNQAALGIAHLDATGRFLDANRKLCEMVGTTRAILQRKSLPAITCADDIPALANYLHQLAANADAPAAHEREVRLVRADDSLVWVALSVAGVFGESGKLEHFVAIIQDITARKEAEEQLRTLVRARKVMAECSRLLVHATTEEQFLREMCQALVSSGDYLVAWVGMPEHDTARSIRTVAHAGLAGEGVTDVPFSWADGPSGAGTAGTAIRDGQPCVIAEIDAAVDPAWWHPLAQDFGIGAEASLPLIHAGAAYGVLSLLARDPDAFDSEEMTLLEELADDVSYGIVALRTRIEREKAEAQLRSSQERFQRYFAIGLSGMAIASPAGRWVEVNEKLCSILGYARDDLLQMTWQESTHPDDWARCNALVQRMVTGEIEGATLGKRCVRKDGGVIDVTAAARTTRHADGSVDCFLVQIDDVTERKRQEDAVRRLSAEVEQQYRIFNTALSSIGDFAFIFDSQARFVYANRALLKALGRTADEVLGKDLASLRFSPDQAHAVGQHVQQVLATGQRVIAELSHIGADGLPRDYEYMLYPVEGSAGFSDMVSGAGRDITRRKRTAAALLESERFARSTLDALSQHIAVLDDTGRIVAVNRAWKEFGAANGAAVTTHMEGADYLAVCDKAATHGDSDAAQVVKMILAVLAGERAQPAWEYPCHGPEGDQWFSVRVSRFDDRDPVRVVVVHTDITERKRAEDAQAESERRFRDMLGGVQVMAVMLDCDGVVTYCNDHLLQVTHWSRDELVGRNWFDAMELRGRSDPKAAFSRLIANRTPAWDAQNTIRTREGEYRTVLWNNSLLRSASGEVIGSASIGEDITERQKTEEQLRLQANLLSAVGQAVIATSLNGDITYANPFAGTLYGWTLPQMLGRNIVDVTLTEASKRQRLDFLSRVRKGASWTEEFQVRHRGGRVFPAQVSHSPIRDAAGRPVGSIGVSFDNTQRKTYEQQIEYLATHDALTGLPNRNLLNDRLTQAISLAQRSQMSLGMLFLDLDHFKYVNDAFGHPVGDALLKAIAQRLRGVVRDTDTVARLGGDEFVVLLTGLQEPLLGASKVAQNIAESFSRPFQLDGHDLAVTASIGISLFPEDGASLDELLKNADTAMYRAKELGRNDYHFYASEMSSRALKRVTLEVGLRKALELDQFELHYQPLVNMATGDVVGAEALLRWTHPELGVVSPVDFIPLAEETGLIVSIGEWVLRTACVQNRAWQAAGLPPFAVAVNLSPLQLRQPSFVTRVRQILDESGLDPHCLNLEITESMLLGHSDNLVTSLNELRDAGITLSMDDFGTGYSNLGYLTHLPLDTLKIDRSFVRDLPDNAGAASIARAIVSMGRSLGMQVVAEGVETREQAEFLQSLWCELAQGFLYCRPLPAGELARWIKATTPRGKALESS